MRILKLINFNNGLLVVEKQPLVSYGIIINSEKRMCPLGE